MEVDSSQRPGNVGSRQSIGQECPPIIRNRRSPIEQRSSSLYLVLDENSDYGESQLFNNSKEELKIPEEEAKEEEIN